MLYYFLRIYKTFVNQFLPAPGFSKDSKKIRASINRSWVPSHLGELGKSLLLSTAGFCSALEKYMYSSIFYRILSSKISKSRSRCLIWLPFWGFCRIHLGKSLTQKFTAESEEEKFVQVKRQASTESLHPSRLIPATARRDSLPSPSPHWDWLWPAFQLFPECSVWMQSISLNYFWLFIQRAISFLWRKGNK